MIEKPYYRLTEVARALDVDPLEIVDLAGMGKAVLHAKLSVTNETFDSECLGHTLSDAEEEGLALGLVLVECMDSDEIAARGTFPWRLGYGHRMVRGTLKQCFFDIVEVTDWHLCIVRSEFERLEAIYREVRQPKPVHAAAAPALMVAPAIPAAVEVAPAPDIEVTPDAVAIPEGAGHANPPPDRIKPTPGQIEAWGPALADRLCNNDSGEWTEGQRADLIAVVHRTGNPRQASFAIDKGISERRIRDLMRDWGVARSPNPKSRDAEKTQLNKSLQKSEPHRNPHDGYSDFQFSKRKSQ